MQKRQQKRERNSRMEAANDFQVAVYLDPRLVREIVPIAHAEYRSPSAQIAWILQQYLNQRQKLILLEQAKDVGEIR